MFSRRIATARPLRAALPIARRTALLQQRAASGGPTEPGLGGDYPSLVSTSGALLADELYMGGRSC